MPLDPTRCVSLRNYCVVSMGSRTELKRLILAKDFDLYDKKLKEIIKFEDLENTVGKERVTCKFSKISFVFFLTLNQSVRRLVFGNTSLFILTFSKTEKLFVFYRPWQICSAT